MAGSNKGGSTGTGAVVVVVLVVAVVAGVAFTYLNSGSSEYVAATYPVRVEGAVVVAGNPAPTTIDVYEDLLCPSCARLESEYGADLTRAANQGQAQVRYHPVAILDQATDPPGYSTRAANAVICSAEAGIFGAYHDRLFEEQPREGSEGLSNAELIAIGQELGAGPGFEQCVNSGEHNRAIAAATRRAVENTSIHRPGGDGFGTPTVTVNGQRVDVSDGDWLSDALS